MARLPAATGAQGGGSGRIEAGGRGYHQPPPRFTAVDFPLFPCDCVRGGGGRWTAAWGMDPTGGVASFARSQWRALCGLGHGSDRRCRLVRRVTVVGLIRRRRAVQCACGRHSTALYGYCGEPHRTSVGRGLCMAPYLVLIGTPVAALRLRPHRGMVRFCVSVRTWRLTSHCLAELVFRSAPGLSNWQIRYEEFVGSDRKINAAASTTVTLRVSQTFLEASYGNHDS
jgi:hypothetical protein